MNEHQLPTHNIKQLGFSVLRNSGSRANFLQRWIGTQPENPTVSYCQTLGTSMKKKTYLYQNDNV